MKSSLSEWLLLRDTYRRSHKAYNPLTDTCVMCGNSGYDLDLVPCDVATASRYSSGP